MPQIVIVRDGRFGRMGEAMAIGGPNTYTTSQQDGVYIVDGDARVELPGGQDVLVILRIDRTEIYTDQEARDRLPKSE